MKKYVFSIFILIACLLMSVSAYAGNVPEELLSDDYAQVYFGEIKSIDGNGENITATVIQRQNVKGDFENGRERVYAKVCFFSGDTPEVGKTYLCGYLDENNPIYIWEASSLDTKTLTILNKSGSGMDERMEEYLNEGLFDEAEQKRLDNAEAKATAYNTADAEDKSTPAAEHTASNKLWLPVGGGLLILFAALAAVYIRKKKR